VKPKLAQLGRRVLGGLGGLCPLRAVRGHEVICFFATPDIGGAERIHARIVAAIADAKPLVCFTEQPRNAGLLPEYERHAEVLQLAPDGRRRAREYLLEGRVAAAINKAEFPVVFGAFSHFFYQLLPRLKPHVRAVDLTHNFGIGFENFSLRHVPRLDARVVIADWFREQYGVLYDAFGLEEYAERMRVIPNAVEVPDALADKPAGRLQVLYVGRDSPEKRVQLVGEVAARVPEAEFTLIGVDESALARRAS
jgi:L-malate glycosyltransferase